MRRVWKITLIINLFALNVFAAFMFWQWRNLPQSNQQDNSGLTEIKQDVADGCRSECQEYIKMKIAEVLVSPSVTLTPTKSVTTVGTGAPRTKVKSVSYLPIPGSGSTLENDWVKISGTDFYMSKADYQGLTGVYFEANVKLINGNGKAYVRLFDITHSVGVQGSELSTSSQTSVFISTNAISLWEGYNHYAIQVKSLTADTTVFESGRLKIMTEN